MACLEDSDLFVQKSAALALIHLDDLRGFDKLIPLLRDDQWTRKHQFLIVTALFNMVCRKRAELLGVMRSQGIPKFLMDDIERRLSNIG